MKIILESLILSLLILGLFTGLPILLGTGSSISVLLPNSDLPSYWLGAKFMLHGGNPYDFDALSAFGSSLGFEKVGILYVPPWLLALFIPFSTFSFLSFACIFFVVSILSLSLIVTLSLRLGGGTPESHRRFLIIALFYYPTLVTLSLLQVSLVHSLIALIGVFALSKSNRVALALCISVAIFKPQSNFLLYLGLFYYGVIRFRLSFILLVASTMTLWVMLAEVSSPGITSLWLASNYSPLQWMGVSLVTPIRLLVFNLTQSLPAWPLFVVPGLALLVTLVLLITQGRKRSLPNIPILIALSSILTPYGWIYDWVTLLPLIVWLMLSIKEQDGYQRSLSIVCLALAYIAPLLIFTTNLPSFMIFWVPLLLLLPLLNFPPSHMTIHRQQ